MNELDELRRRLAEAERDAARYRFLRDQDGMGNIFMHTPTCDLDATIDREIAADSADAGRCECNCRTDTLCAFCTDARLNGSAVQPERCCLDYPRCDCNSPPEPAQEPKGCNHFPGQVNCEWCTEVPHE